MRKLHNYKFYKPIRKFLRNNPTSSERLLWINLKASQLGFKFRRQQGIGKYVVDFYCPAVNLAIEIDGATHNDVGVRANDIKKEEFLLKRGFVVKRYTDEQVFTNPGRVLENIIALCKMLAGTTPNPLLGKEGDIGTTPNPLPSHAAGRLGKEGDIGTTPNPLPSHAAGRLGKEGDE